MEAKIYWQYFYSYLFDNFAFSNHLKLVQVNQRSIRHFYFVISTVEFSIYSYQKHEKNKANVIAPLPRFCRRNDSNPYECEPTKHKRVCVLHIVRPTNRTAVCVPSFWYVQMRLQRASVREPWEGIVLFVLIVDTPHARYSVPLKFPPFFGESQMS